MEDADAEEASVVRRLRGRRSGGRARDGSAYAREGGDASEYVGGGMEGSLASALAVWEG
jgi:hypothetical protein